MSGIAVIIPNADFSGLNLGKVTFLRDEAVTGLTINAGQSYTGQTAQLSVSYLPASTNQRGCTWSILSGSEYATVDSGTGVLTILSGANAASVTVKATSIFDEAVAATKTLSVTYSEEVPITGLQISGPSSVEGTKAQCAAVFTPANTTQTGIVWSVDNQEVCQIDNNGLLTISSIADGDTVTITATSTVDSTITATKQVVLTYKEPVDYWNLKGNVGYVPFDASLLNGKNVYIEVEFKDSMTSGTTNDAIVILNNEGTGQNLSLTINNNSGYYKAVNARIRGKFARSNDSVSFTKLRVKANVNNYISFFSDSTSIGGGQGGGTETKSGSPYLVFGVSPYVDLSGYQSNDALSNAVTDGIVVTPANTADAKIKRIRIVATTTGYATIDAAFNSTTESPLVDIRINDEGQPYNAGSSGILIYTNF